MTGLRPIRQPLRRSPAAGLLALVLIGAAAGGAHGQEGGAPAGEAPPAGAVTDPVPYERSEFPEWAHALRRAEVVALGALPITLIGVRLVYGFARYAAHGFTADGAGSPPATWPDVRPFPFGPIGGSDLTDTEEIGLIIGAVALAVTIALIDADLQRDRPPAAPDR